MTFNLSHDLVSFTLFRFYRFSLWFLCNHFLSVHRFRISFSTNRFLSTVFAHSLPHFLFSLSFSFSLNSTLIPPLSYHQALLFHSFMLLFSVYFSIFVPSLPLSFSVILFLFYLLFFPFFLFSVSFMPDSRLTPSFLPIQYSLIFLSCFLSLLFSHVLSLVCLFSFPLSCLFLFFNFSDNFSAFFSSIVRSPTLSKQNNSYNLEIISGFK